MVRDKGELVQKIHNMRFNINFYSNTKYINKNRSGLIKPLLFTNIYTYNFKQFFIVFFWLSLHVC